MAPAGEPCATIIFSEIQAKGFRTLQENQRVEFTVKAGPKGPQASAIRPI